MPGRKPVLQSPVCILKRSFPFWNLPFNIFVAGLYHESAETWASICPNRNEEIIKRTRIILWWFILFYRAFTEAESVHRPCPHPILWR